METILNLVWLAITLIAIWLWRFRWIGSHRKRSRNAWQEAFAMVCVLALLFPVISLTDDLHPQIVPVDSSSSKRCLCLLAAHGTQGGAVRTPSNHPSVFALLGAPAAELELAFAGLVQRTEMQRPGLSLGILSGRAPPSLV